MSGLGYLVEDAIYVQGVEGGREWYFAYPNNSTAAKRNCPKNSANCKNLNGRGSAGLLFTNIDMLGEPMHKYEGVGS